MEDKKPAKKEKNPTPNGRKRKKKRVVLCKLPFFDGTFAVMASGKKTSLLVSAAQFPWIVRMRRGYKLYGYHPAQRGFRGVLCIVSVCVHDDLAAVESCGKHHPEQISPNRPNWEMVLGNARTGGQFATGPVMISERNQAKRAAATWVVIDFTYKPNTGRTSPAESSLEAP